MSPTWAPQVSSCMDFPLERPVYEARAFQVTGALRSWEDFIENWGSWGTLGAAAGGFEASEVASKIDPRRYVGDRPHGGNPSNPPVG